MMKFLEKPSHRPFSGIAMVVGIFAIALAVTLTANFFGGQKAQSAILGAPIYSTAVNGTSTCGQLANGNIVFGATSSTVSNGTGTSPFSITINGTTVTSTATATTTVNALVNALVPLIPSSTLGISVGSSTNGTTTQINVTSTAWGNFVTLQTNPGQYGFTYATTSTFPSTQIVANSSGRNYFSATLDIGSTTAKWAYLCKGPSCALQTGLLMTTTTVPYLQNSTDPYNGPYSCISATNTSTLMNYTTSQ